MFERYTEKARRVIFFARYEASAFGGPCIETEHLLLGLFREDKVFTDRLRRSGASAESIRKQIEGRTPVREKIPTSVDLPLSQELKRVLAHAAEESEKLSHKYIDTGHLVLGLLREDKGLAREVLQQCGLRLHELREEVRRGWGEAPAPARTPRSPRLSVISHDLSEAATEDELDPLVGREEELERVIQILCRRTRNNPVLVGEPGVGKTAIVHGLARRIAGGNVPSHLERTRLLALDLSPILTVTGESGRIEERVMAVLNELKEAAKLVILMEDIFTPRGREASLNMANLLKPLLIQGEIQCIAAAIPSEFRKATEKEPWLEGCFHAVEVPPPDEAQAIKVLVGIRQRYERFHGVTYTDEALKHAVYHSQRYIPGRHLPDKAIDLIDEAGAGVAMRRGVLPEEVMEVQKRVRFVAQRIGNAIANHEFEKAKSYEEEERKERENLKRLFEKHHIDATRVDTVGVDHIEDVVARWTGLPISTIRQERTNSAPGGPEGQV